MWGAGGYGPASNGGNGAYVEGILDVNPGQEVTVMVGQAGSITNAVLLPSYGGGGLGGGGRSAIRINDEDIATAGGGGGAARSVCDSENGNLLCPEGYTSYGGHCYKAHSSSPYVTWYAANLKCSNVGGWLPDVNSDEEHDLIFGMLDGSKQAWLGLNDLKSEGNFEWSGGQQSPYRRWGPNGADNWCGVEHCVHINPDTSWNDNECDASFMCLCKTKECSIGGVGAIGGSASYSGGNGAVSTACSGSHAGGGGDSSGGCSAATNALEPSGKYQGASAKCAPGRTFNNGYCYWKNTDGLSWNNAQTACAMGGGWLTDIQSDNENNFITSLTPNGVVWIGLRGENTFTWVGGQPVTYTHWRPGEPNNPGENCAYMYNGDWADFACSGIAPSICKTNPAHSGGGGGYYGGGASHFGAGGGGSSYVANLRDPLRSVSLVGGVCAGSDSPHFDKCSSDCGSSNRNGCVVIDYLLPTEPWCVNVGLFDSFGDGWGDDIVLRLYDKNAPYLFVDVSNSNKAFKESTVCLNPSAEILASIYYSNVEVLQPWEMYFTISDESGQSFTGNFDTVLLLNQKTISVFQNPIYYDDERWSCTEKCERGRGERRSEKIIDMTGEGWCTKDRSQVNVPEYDVIGKKIVGYSSVQLPQVLTSPEYVISSFDRTTLVLSGTLREQSRKHRHRRSKKKKGDKNRNEIAYGAILCDKEDSLPDGSYVFRINGALSSEHPHRDTKWEFCGDRGTSAEELSFSIIKGKCKPIEKKSRWELSGLLNLVDFSGSMTMYFDDLATLQALGDFDYNEVFLDELESSLLTGISALNEMVVFSSVYSIVLNASLVNVEFGFRLNTALDHNAKSLSEEARNSFIAAQLQEQLASTESIDALMDTLHQCPEFAGLTNIVITDVAYDHKFRPSSEQGEEYDTQGENQKSFFRLHPAVGYASISFLGFIAIGAAMRRYT